MNFARVKHLDIFYMKVYFFTILLIGFFAFKPNMTKAQDTIQLKSINIFGFRANQFSNSINIEKADSFIIANSTSRNLGEILSGFGNLNVKSYGYGGITNVTMRGGNSYQTAILWNGINLQDPLNGGINLATLPGFFMDKIEIHSGGETSLFGSGAMGGSILISSKAKYNQGQNLEVMLSSGSFSNFQGGIGYSVSGKKISSDLKIFHKQAQNNFGYYNSQKKENPLEYQENAQINQTALMQKNSLMLTSNQILNLDFYYIKSTNHLPYSMTQTIESESYTNTNNGRATLNWAFIKDGIKLKARSAFLFNALQYHDLNTSFDYLHKSVSSINEIETDVKLFKKQLLMLGINNTYNKGISESLSPDAQQNRTSVFASYKHNYRDKLFVKVNLRQEFVPYMSIPLTYSLRSNYKTSYGLSFYVSYGKTFRIPTFNDLFWNDFSAKGNPNLKPEWGKNAEAGINYEINNTFTSVRVKLNGFASEMNDLIQWAPVNGIWMPQNYEQVSTKGLESSVEGIYSTKKSGLIKINLSYTYLRSTLSKTDYLYPEDVLGKQMIFTPKHKGNLILRWIKGRYFTEYQQSFSGRIYTTTDNTGYLNPFTIGNLSFGYNFNLKENTLNATFRLYNIWNSEYYTMPNYAMPGINYEISVHLKLKTK